MPERIRSRAFAPTFADIVGSDASGAHVGSAISRAIGVVGAAASDAFLVSVFLVPVIDGGPARPPSIFDRSFPDGGNEVVARSHRGLWRWHPHSHDDARVLVVRCGFAPRSPPRRRHRRRRRRGCDHPSTPTPHLALPTTRPSFHRRAVRFAIAIHAFLEFEVDDVLPPVSSFRIPHAPHDDVAPAISPSPHHHDVVVRRYAAAIPSRGQRRGDVDVSAFVRRAPPDDVTTSSIALARLELPVRACSGAASTDVGVVQ
jgi:hypothetical protein